MIENYAPRANGKCKKGPATKKARNRIRQRAEKQKKLEERQRRLAAGEEKPKPDKSERETGPGFRRWMKTGELS